jgi:hypothetical protein
LEEKISNTTIRPAASPPSLSPTLDITSSSNGTAKASSSAISPPPPQHEQQPQYHHHDTKTAFEPPETPQYEHDYFQRLRTMSDLNNKRSQDLEDYLNTEIE